MEFVEKNSTNQTSSVTLRQAVADPRYSRVTWIIVTFSAINVLFQWMTKLFQDVSREIFSKQENERPHTLKFETFIIINIAMSTFLDFPALYIVNKIKRRTGMLTGIGLVVLCYFLMGFYEMIKLNPVL